MKPTTPQNARSIAIGLSWQLPVMAVTLLGILVFSLVFHPPMIGGLVVDKPSHALAYALLTVLFTSAPWTRPRHLIAWTAVLALSLLLEGAQLWIPGRLASLDDIAANVLGVVLGGPLAAFGLNAMRAVRRRRR